MRSIGINFWSKIHFQANVSLCFALAVSWGTFPRYNLNFVFYFFSFYSIFFFFVRFLILFPFPITLNFSSNLCFCFFGIRLFFFRLLSFVFLPFGQKNKQRVFTLFSFSTLFRFLFQVSCMLVDSEWCGRWVLSALYWELLGLELEFLLDWLWGSSSSSIQSLMKSRYNPDGFFAYYPLLICKCIVWFPPVFTCNLVVHSMSLLICFFGNVFEIFSFNFFYSVPIEKFLTYCTYWVWECENALFLLCHQWIFYTLLSLECRIRW